MARGNTQAACHVDHHMKKKNSGRVKVGSENVNGEEETNTPI